MVVHGWKRITEHKQIGRDTCDLREICFVHKVLDLCAMRSHYIKQTRGIKMQIVHDYFTMTCFLFTFSDIISK